MTPAQRDKLLKLEGELHDLKTELGLVKAEQPRFFLWRFFDWVVKYWPIWALIILYGAHQIYGVPYFESVLNSSITRDSSNYFLQLGDSMMEHAEFKAAEEAYANALEVNPNNIKATHGLMKAQVLSPVGSDKRYAPVVVDARLTFLNGLFPGDYILPYWEGVKLRSQNEPEKARECFLASVARNPKFIGGYLELGYTNLITRESDINAAIDNFCMALGLDPNYAAANNGLGYCYLYQAVNDTPNREDAEKLIREALVYFRKSDAVAPERADTKLNLGDAYRLRPAPDRAVSYRNALTSHRNALEIAEAGGGGEKAGEGEKAEKTGKAGEAEGGAAAETFDDVRLIFPFVAEVPGAGMVRTYAQVRSREQMKLFILYALSFDYALLDKRDLADARFDEAYRLDVRKEYNDFFRNKMRTLVAALQPQGRVREWFDAKMKFLAAGEEAAGSTKEARP